MDRRCETCRWSTPSGSPWIRVCRRYPPNASTVDSLNGWPDVGDTQHCGEWAAREGDEQPFDSIELLERLGKLEDNLLKLDKTLDLHRAQLRTQQDIDDVLSERIDKQEGKLSRTREWCSTLQDQMSGHEGDKDASVFARLYRAEAWQRAFDQRLEKLEQQVSKLYEWTVDYDKCDHSLYERVTELEQWREEHEDWAAAIMEEVAGVQQWRRDIDQRFERAGERLDKVKRVRGLDRCVTCNGIVWSPDSPSIDPPANPEPAGEDGGGERFVTLDLGDGEPPLVIAVSVLAAAGYHKAKIGKLYQEKPGDCNAVYFEWRTGDDEIDWAYIPKRAVVDAGYHKAEEVAKVPTFNDNEI